jgi:succinate dehydrogenase / fumarate reductase cytochrome b subunit
MATTTNPPTGAGSASPGRKPGVAPIRKRPSGPLIVRFYRSAVGKKWVMAVTGVILIGFVVAHLIGNLKLFLSKEEINLYGEALRAMPGALLPRTVLLWIIRIVLILAFVFHIHSAAGLTLMNRRARPSGYRYQSKRDYLAADYASRTMRFTGVFVLLFLVFHLMDLTWGNANSQFLRGDPYNNLVYSLERPAAAVVYALGAIALAIHLYHGTWSMFQSLGITNPRYNSLRRRLAQGLALFMLVGNLSFPIAVQLHLVEPKCPHTQPTTAVCSTGTSKTLPSGGTQ